MVKDLVGSIKAGKFDEKLAAHLETGGLALVDSFRKETLSKKLCDTEQQLAIYFCYLKRIVATFGVEEIRPWSSMILGCLQRDGSDEADPTPTLELLTSTTASLVQLVMQKETALTNAQAATIASSASSASLSTSSSSSAMASHQGSASPIPISSSVGSSASSPQLHGGDASSSSTSAAMSVGGVSSDSTSTTTTPQAHLMQISTSLSPTLMSHHHQHYPFYYGSQTSTTTMMIASPTLGTSLPPISATLSPEKMSSLGLNPPPSLSSTSSTSTSGHSPSSSLTTQSVAASLPNSGSSSNINSNNNINNSFRQKVFNLYFTRRSSTIERILLDYADTQTFVCFL